MMDPEKDPQMCLEEREFRSTTLEDIARSKEDKHRGGGPRCGPYQATIPGEAWQALPKYDFTTSNRSTAFNERMHVEWENHVNGILKNGGELTPVSVVAKAGFRSCAPCCRDMLALAHPTGKAFVMVDLADDDKRGTFHFVAGGEYLPVPKESCSEQELKSLKDVVVRAQSGEFQSSSELLEAVHTINPPVDQIARNLYLGDAALLPVGCAQKLKGNELLEVLHAEHFARLSAEYGASILRDTQRPQQQIEAIIQCRKKAEANLLRAWAPHLVGYKVDLQKYVSRATAPLIPEAPADYEQFRRSLGSARSVGPLTEQRVKASQQGAHDNNNDNNINIPTGRGKWKKTSSNNASSLETPSPTKFKLKQSGGANALVEDDRLSTMATTIPDDVLSTFSGSEDSI